MKKIYDNTFEMRVEQTLKTLSTILICTQNMKTMFTKKQISN